MNKSIILTGGSGNLGKKVLEALLSKGYHIFAPVRFEEHIREIQGPDVEASVLDLADEQEVARYVAQASSEREIAAAVLLAGGFEAGALPGASMKAIHSMIHLNFETSFHAVRQLLPLFEARGMGRFVLVGSRSAMEPSEGMHHAAYALSKGLVLQLAELVNAYGKDKNIDATVIIPSTIDTAANRQAMPDADFSKMVSPQAIAESIVFALSESGLQMRGSVLKLYNQS